MDEHDKHLLMEHDTIILPESIDHDTQRIVSEAVIIHPGPIKLFCHGNGGYSRDMRSILSLIRRHGYFTGMLTGAAVSSHAIIWASCQMRYVYDFGAIGLHRVVTTDPPPYTDGPSLMQSAEYSIWVDQQCAMILAEASNQDSDFWLEKINSATLDLCWVRREQLIEYEMAQPVEKLGDWEGSVTSEKIAFERA